MQLLYKSELWFVVCVFLFSAALSANEFVDAKGKSVVDLGIGLSDSEIENLPAHVFFDGTGLPDGSGTAVRGAGLYAEHCAACHGAVGQGGKALELVGDISLLATDYPDKGIAAYWPYAPTLYEYINRSMPPQTPGMFRVDELYSIIAHLLELNEVIESRFILDKQSLSDLELPNRNGFRTIAR